jgi:membrane protein YqaA with SNARE-associated domain
MPLSPEKPEGPGRWKPSAPRKRVILILSETAAVLALLLVWILSEGVRQSTSLWVLFLYSFPSEFLVGLVPHEPVLLYYGLHHPAWVVALVAVVSTVMAEGMNYSLFDLFYGVPALQEASEKGAVRKITDLFGRAPFTAILIAGFTPVPFFPVRFLVVMTAYPVWKYLLGVFLSRAPRFYLLAFFGGVLDIPGSILAVLFAAMLAAVNLPALFKLFSGGIEETNPGSGHQRGAGS